MRFAKKCKWNFLLFFMSYAWSDWNPELCFPGEDLEMLKDPIFQQLKADLAEEFSTAWCSKEKINLLMDLLYIAQPEVCVEVGVFSGSSIIPVCAMLRYLQKGTAVAIDAWSNADAIRYIEDDDPNLPGWTYVDLLSAYLQFMRRLEERSLDCVVIPNNSESASELVDEIDFLHLDGDYTEKGSMLDVDSYLPRVKPGGYILISNLFIMVNGKPPKMRAFSKLFDACEMICEIDRDNAVLFCKN